GIRLNNVANVTLQNLDLSDPPGNYNQTGIVLENGSNNVTITNANVSGTVNGIRVSSSNNVTITNVNASDTSTGIQIDSSVNPTVQNNTLNNSGTGTSALFFYSVSGLVAGAVSGNTFAGSGNAL